MSEQTHELPKWLFQTELRKALGDRGDLLAALKTLVEDLLATGTPNDDPRIVAAVEVIARAEGRTP